MGLSWSSALTRRQVIIDWMSIFEHWSKHFLMYVKKFTWQKGRGGHLMRTSDGNALIIVLYRRGPNVDWNWEQISWWILGLGPVLPISDKMDWHSCRIAFVNFILVFWMKGISCEAHEVSSGAFNRMRCVRRSSSDWERAHKGTDCIDNYIWSLPDTNNVKEWQWQ